MRADAAQFDGWTPTRLYWQEARPFVEWCDLGGRCSEEPFFDQTVERAMRRPFNLLFRRRTPLEALGELLEESPGIPPAGIIFHMTRCGSTLVSQMLATLPHSVVISEAGLIDSVIRADTRDPEADERRRATWLRWVAGALGQRRGAGESLLFIKLDAWHTLDLPLVRRAFPGVPLIFLYREPVEVMVSQLKRVASWMLTGALEPRLLGIDVGEVLRLSRTEYCARVLAKICEAALRHRDDGLRLVNYTQLPEAMWSPAPGLFGVAYTADDLGRMRRAALFDAKSPRVRFAADGEEKNRVATDEIRLAAERWLRPLYEQLEEARLSQEAAPDFEVAGAGGASGTL